MLIIKTTIPDFNEQMLANFEENPVSIDRNRLMFQVQLLNILILPVIDDFVKEWTPSNRFHYGLVEPKDSDFFKYLKNSKKVVDTILASDKDFDMQDSMMGIWHIQNSIRIFIQAVRDMDPPPPNKELFLTDVFEVNLSP